jgi:hypothetical protein
MFTAFAGHRLIATGPEAEVAAAASVAMALGADRVVIFEDATGRQVELDLRGPRPSLAGASERIAPKDPAEIPASPGRGRPKLGVVAREVTLLPRHWDWLGQQPGGASAALRRLVDEARRTHAGADEARQRQQALYGVMSVLAGDLLGFEAATRALYSGDEDGLRAAIAAWPSDISAYLNAQAQGRDHLAKA